MLKKKDQCHQLAQTQGGSALELAIVGQSSDNLERHFQWRPEPGSSNLSFLT